MIEGFMGDAARPLDAFLPHSMALGVVNLLMLAVVDFFICKVLGLGKARWFLLHAIGNLYVVITAFGDVVKTLDDPVLSMSLDSDKSDLPTPMVLMIHLYHVIAFSNLTTEDYFHHLAFAGVGFILELFFVDIGAAQNFYLMWICGAPGMIDYFLLALVKLGKLQSIQEKRINAFVNNWIRGPGLVAAMTVCWVGYRSGSFTGHPALIPPLCLVSLVNGQHYSRRVVANYAIKQTLADIHFETKDCKYRLDVHERAS